MGELQLRQLVDPFRESNAASGISGILLHSGGHFIQVLEGHPMRIASLFDRIARDPRHQDVHQLLSQPAEERLFPHWGIQLANIDRALPLDRARIDKLVLRLRLRNGTVDPYDVLTLLQEFRRQVMAGAA